MKKLIALFVFASYFTLAQTAAIPVAGTTTLNPVTGTIVVKTTVSGRTILVDTVNGQYFIGAGNRKDLGLASTYSRIGFGKLGAMILENNDGTVRNAISFNDPSLNLSNTDGTNNTLIQQNPDEIKYYCSDGTGATSVIDQTVGDLSLATSDGGSLISSIDVQTDKILCASSNSVSTSFSQLSPTGISIGTNTSNASYTGISYNQNAYNLLTTTNYSLTAYPKGKNDLLYAPKITYGTGLTVSGSAPNQTLTATGGGGTTYSFTPPLAATGTVVSIPQSNSVTAGYLGTSDFNNFTGKQNSLIPTPPKTASYTLVPSDLVITDCSTGNVTITLPNAPVNKTVAAIKMVTVAGTFSTIVNTSGSDVINKTGGLTSFSMTLQGQGVMLEYSAGIWYVLADDLPLSQLKTIFTPTLSGTGYIYQNGSTTTYTPSIPNASLSNSTISGVSLGNNLSNHTNGYGLTGSLYNGSTPITWNADTTVLSSKLYTTAKLAGKQNTLNGSTSQLLTAGGTTVAIGSGLSLSSGTLTSSGGGGSGTMTGTLVANQVAYGVGTNTLTSSNNFSVSTSTNNVIFGVATPTLNANPTPGDPSHIFEVTTDGNSTNQFSLRFSTYGTGSGQNDVHWNRYRGTIPSPSAILNGDYFLSFGGRGWDGSKTSQSAVAFQMQASENWTTSANGARILFGTNANGTTSIFRNQSLVIDHNGYLGIGDYFNGGGLYPSSLFNAQFAASTTPTGFYSYQLGGTTLGANLYRSGDFLTYAYGTGTGLMDYSSGNIGLSGRSQGTTSTGYNCGVYGLIKNSSVLNIAVMGNATLDGTNPSVGVLGLANATSMQVGGYFGLNTTMPTFTSAALIADNSSTSSPVFLGRVNGSTVFTIGSTGNVISSNNITASTFSVPSGLGTTFLMANGSFNNNVYLTGNQSITLSGDVTGSGSTAITTSLSATQPNIKTANALTSVGTLTTGVWNATAIGTAYLPANQTQLTTATALTSVGTVTTGVWNGTLLAGTYGGTGVNNGAKTITLGGNLTTTGAFNTSFTQQGSLTITLPALATTLLGKTGTQVAGQIPFMNDASQIASATTFSYSSGSTRLFVPYLTLAANTTTNASLILGGGTVLTTTVSGAIENDNSNLNYTNSTGRFTLDKVLAGSATLDFPSTAANATSDLTITVTGAAVGDPVTVGAGNTQLTNSLYTAQVTATNTVTVRFVNINNLSAQDPASGTFRVSVMKQ